MKAGYQSGDRATRTLQRLIGEHGSEMRVVNTSVFRGPMVCDTSLYLDTADDRKLDLKPSNFENNKWEGDIKFEEPAR
jgi:hypothetical protein